MENQIPSSTPPQMNQPIPGQITPEILEQMKQQAREMAIAQHMAQQQVKVESPAAPAPSKYPSLEELKTHLYPPLQAERIIYVRRNLTIAELIVVFVISIGIVTGVPATWRFLSDNLPRVHIQVK